MKFTDKLSAAWQGHRSLLCVGLDPDLPRLPEGMRDNDGIACERDNR